MNSHSHISSSPIRSVAGKAINWSIALSALLLIAGLFAILIPLISGIAITVFIGWAILISAVTHFVLAFKTHSTGSLIWELLLGAVYLFAGAYLIFHPLAGLVSLTLLLAAYLFIKGVLEIIHAFQLRPRDGYIWLILDGIVTLILALMIWLAWPVSSAWAIGTLIGISLLFSGLSRLMLSLTAKRILGQVS